MRIVTKWLRLELRVCRCIVALYLRHLRIKFDDEIRRGCRRSGRGRSTYVEVAYDWQSVVIAGYVFIHDVTLLP